MERFFSHYRKLGIKRFVIVDNNSLNSKEEVLLNNYKIDILKLDDNYGFAKANNFGIEYAKNNDNVHVGTIKEMIDKFSEEIPKLI